MSQALRASCGLRVAMMCCIFFLASATQAQTSFDDVWRDLQRQFEQKLKDAPPLDTAQWNTLREGMSAKQVLEKFGQPIAISVLRGTDGQPQSRWGYYFDHGTRARELRFGSPVVAPGSLVSTISGHQVTGEEISGTLFYWSGRLPSSAASFPLPGSTLVFVVPYSEQSPKGKLLGEVSKQLVAQWKIDSALILKSGTFDWADDDYFSKYGSAPIFAARTPADGTTLLAVNVHDVIKARLRRGRLKYDMFQDFKPVALLVKDNPLTVMVAANSPATNLKELAALAHERPLRAGIHVTGSLAHLSLELFNQLAGCDIKPALYPPRVSTIPDLLAGKLDLVISYVNVHLEAIRSGKIRALAVTGLAPSLSDLRIPLASESGFPEFEARDWVALLAAKDTPDDIVAKLGDALVATMAHSEVAAVAAAESMVVDAHTASETSAFLKREIDRWTLVQEKGSDVPATSSNARLCYREWMSAHEFLIDDSKDDSFNAGKDNLFKPTGEMKLKAFIREANKNKVRLEKISDTQFLVGTTIFFFSENRLTEIQECP